MKSELHSELQHKARVYLLNKTYWICSEEMPTPMGIIDCWGMSRARGFETMAIEVKVSRADFRSNSQKLKEGHPEGIANECYILCPAGLIQPEEVHEDWGLLWYHEGQDKILDSKASRLSNKKKATRFEMTDRAKLEILINFLENGANSVIPKKLEEIREAVKYPFVYPDNVDKIRETIE